MPTYKVTKLKKGSGGRVKDVTASVIGSQVTLKVTHSLIRTSTCLVNWLHN